MKKALILIILSISVSAFAVDVPDFSFKGDEITSFSIKQEFRDVKLDIAVKSEYEKYIEKESINVSTDETGEYSSEEPSFFYSFRPTTAIASVFVGDKAYRNYLVKKYVQSDYQSILTNYPKYKASVKTPEFIEEIDLIYALAKDAEGDAEALNGVYSICATGEYFKNIACDKYFGQLWQNEDYLQIAVMGQAVERPVPAYTFSAYILSLFRLERYSEAEKQLLKNPDQIFYNPEFNDFLAVIAYYKGNYIMAAKYAPFVTDSAAFAVADSLINLGHFDDALILADKVQDPSDRAYLSAKLNIGLKNISIARNTVKDIKNETLLFNVLNYYAAREMPAMNESFVASFQFADVDKSSYPYYYLGLQQFELKKYADAVKSLEKVAAPEDIKREATFYRGISQVYVNPNKAESDLVSTINYSATPEQVSISRYMLAQVYYMNGRLDDSLQLLDGCTENYCAQLRAEIDLRKGKYSTALSTASGMQGDEAVLLRATAYYNLKKYSEALKELEEMKETSFEAEHLRMMISFKEGNVQKATEIIRHNYSYTPLVYDGIRELILAGDYALAADLIKDKQNLPDSMLVLKAKLLAWQGDKSGAGKIYNQLISKKAELYESFTGTVDLADNLTQELQAIAKTMENLDSYGNFNQKDALLASFASKVSRTKNQVLLIGIINEFFPEYENSPYAAEMYAERAKLFYATGRSSECVQDINLAVSRSADYEADLMLLKAQCLENVDAGLALEAYRNMFYNDEQFRLPAAVKLMDTSPVPAEVLDVARKIKDENPGLYVEGMRRYVEIATSDDLDKNEDYLNRLMADKDTALQCAGMFGTARLLNEREKGREAAAMYEKIYKTAPGDHFAKESLNAAYSIYTQLDMTKEAEEVKKLIK